MIIFIIILLLDDELLLAVSAYFARLVGHRFIGLLGRTWALAVPVLSKLPSPQRTRTKALRLLGLKGGGDERPTPQTQSPSKPIGASSSKLHESHAQGQSENASRFQRRLGLEPKSNDSVYTHRLQSSSFFWFILRIL